MSADLLEAFGSGGQSGGAQTRECSTRTDTGRTTAKNIPTKDYSIQILPTQQRGIPSSPQNPSGRVPSSAELGNDVLFDANVYEALDFAQIGDGDDEFGDFEQVNNGSIPAASSGLIPANSATRLSSLIDLDDHEPSSSSPNPFRIRSEATSGSEADTTMPGLSHLANSEEASLPTKLLIEEEDEWGQFEDVNSTDLTSAIKQNGEKPRDAQPLPRRADALITNKSRRRSKPTVQAILVRAETNNDGFDDDWDQFDEEESETPTANAAQKKGNTQNSVNTPLRSREVRGDRPTNVPPPAILLSLFPQIFSLLYTQAEQTPKNDLGAQVLEAYRVCARIIACRQLRWKRDTVLAQSMRIGAAGRSGGMKLTTLDKGEARREEQDAQEAISSWSRSSHKLNFVMAKAKIAKPPASLSTSLSMRVATGADVLISNHICPICGLKRNERISGIDVNVVDIFGEFWIEQWGHRDCHEIWYTYSHLLDQR